MAFPASSKGQDAHYKLLLKHISGFSHGAIRNSLEHKMNMVKEMETVLRGMHSQISTLQDNLGVQLTSKDDIVSPATNATDLLALLTKPGMRKEADITDIETIMNWTDWNSNAAFVVTSKKLQDIATIIVKPLRFEYMTARYNNPDYTR